MAALFIGIFAGLFAFLFFDKTLLLVRQYVLEQRFASGVRAAAGIVIAQLLWAIIAVSLLGCTRYELVVGKHVNSTHGMDASFVMLSALILAFMAYRVIRKPRLTLENNETIVPGREMGYLLRQALTQPIRILIYVALFCLLGIHYIASAFSNLFFIVLGTGFGAFVAWSVFCSTLDKNKEKITVQQLERFSRWGAGVILLLVVFGLVLIVVN